MANARIIALAEAFTNTAGMPKSVDYGTYFSGLSSLLGWFDFSRAADVTEAGSGVSAVAARAGALTLAQTTDANRPTYDSGTGRISFDATGTQFLVGGGNFPTTAVTIAAILRRSADAIATEGVIGSTNPSSGSHSMFFQVNGELRFRVTDGTEVTFQEPASPTIPINQNILVMADYDQVTDQARCRLDNGLAGTSFGPAGGDITMNTTWFLGGLTSAGSSPCSMEISDLFIFDEALIGTETAENLLLYGQDFKSVA